MKKIISSVIVVGIVGILLISNATVEAAKKRENINQAVEKESVVYVKEGEEKRVDVKETSKKEELKKEVKQPEENNRKDINNEKEKNEKELIKEIKNNQKSEEKEVSIQNNIDLDGKFSKEDFVVLVNGVRIELGTDINTIIDKVGEPDDYVQARSCLHDGDDKIYTYGGIVIYTYPEGKKDIVYIVEYTGEEKTPSGIGLGSTITDIEKAYGTKYVEDAFYTTYELNPNATISFQMENQEVTYIEFYME